MIASLALVTNSSAVVMESFLGLNVNLYFETAAVRISPVG